MRSSFDKIMPLMLAHEGGWADHPLDPGGATMKGITLRTFRDANRRGIVKYTNTPTKDDLRRISQEEVFAIYRTMYWDVVYGDHLPIGIDYMVFDAAVNQGPGRAVRFLQQALTYDVGVDPGPVDGIMGPMTLRAVFQLEGGEHLDLIRCTAIRRMNHYTGIGKAVFLEGWTRRLFEVYQHATEWRLKHGMG
jgi:lysozyme family protein